MRRLLTIYLLALSAMAALVSAPAASAGTGKKASKPSITRVTPMRIGVGDVLTIRGRDFKAKRKANTVIFRGPSGRSAFVKPRRAGRRMLKVVVPAAASRLLTVSGVWQKPTRLKLRVLAGNFSNFTPRRLSPVVTGAAVCNTGGADGDHDSDLLTNSEEARYGTSPCLADTDKDQIVDGWEFWSAKDLNTKAVPYPGRRPYPNPLDRNDGAAGHWDFDGDGLTTYEEYRAWRVSGSVFDQGMSNSGDLQSPLWYSDGSQTSRRKDPLPTPAWMSPAYGLPAPLERFPKTYDRDQSGTYTDDERDADRDGLANWLESAGGPGQPSWWPAVSERPYAGLDLADPDVDGDTLLDGEDDQDFDDWTNLTEILNRGDLVDIGGGTMRDVNPFNPCLPNEDSRTCSLPHP
jgi:hypothetical protein